MTHVAEPPVTGGEQATEQERVNHWINGARVAGASGRTGPVYNPATGQLAREVDFASVEEVDAAVVAAHEAFPAWRATSISRAPSAASARAIRSPIPCEAPVTMMDFSASRRPMARV